jgi:hypothetical protein
MIEKAVHPTAGESHPHHERRLHGVRLWLARGSYFVLFFLVLVFFLVGLPAYLESWTRGGIGATVVQGTDGSLRMSVASSSDAAGVGLRSGDFLVAVDGKAMTSADQANLALIGRIGAPVAVTVRTGAGQPREYSLIFGGGFLNLLNSMHLSLQFLILYNTIISSLLALGAILASPLVFFRRSRDWLTILVAFSMIAFASFLMTPVAFGAYKLHVLFMNNLIYMVGMVSMIIVFFIYPTGHFEPRWIRWLAFFLLIPAFLDFLNLQTYNNTLLDFYLWIGFFALGVFAQVYRYKRVSTPVERQQTKRVMFGMIACFAIIFILDLASILLTRRLSNPQYILFSLFVKAGATLPVLILDLSFVFAIYRYRLWDTDLYINRTLVYSLVTLFLMAIWVVTTQVLNYAFQQFLGKQAGWLGALLSSLQVAVIYRPVRKWVEKWVNNRFYKDRIDYNEALVELKPEMWAYLTPSDLSHTLVTAVPALLQSTSGALFMRERHGLVLTEVHNLHPSDANKFQFSEELMKKLESATVVTVPEGRAFAILVPLTVSRLKVYDLVGVLALGARHQGRGFSRDHVNDLSALGRNAGMALYMLKLNEKKQLREIGSSA